jgi:hypothetical protein
VTTTAITCEPLGYGDKPLYFETMVFHWEPRKGCSCPEMIQWDGENWMGSVEEHRFGGIDDCDLANKTHLETCRRYAAKSENPA